jgi:flagellar hook protein FlgE
VRIRKDIVRNNHVMSMIASIAVAGMAASTARFEASAQRVARDPRADLAKEIVNQKFATAAFEANIAVIRSADAMTKTLLDILA